MELLDRVLIAAPCSVSWETMKGDERVRFCGGCSRNVYNLSDMTKTEAERFLEENGINHCLRLYRRADGTVLTDNCPVGLRQLRKKCRAILKFAAGLLSSMFALTSGARAAEHSTTSTNQHASKAKVCQRSKKAELPTAIMGLPPPIIIPPSFTAQNDGGYQKQTKQIMLINEECLNEASRNSKLDEHESKLANKEAYNTFIDARRAEAEGNFLRAKILYSESMRMLDQEPGFDPKLKELVSEAQGKMERKLGIHEWKPGF